MAQRFEENTTHQLRVMVIDDDQFHANSARSMLTELNFYVTVYRSPIEAINFLANHAKDVDFILAAVHIEELSGLQFLRAAREMHKNLQVINNFQRMPMLIILAFDDLVMSSETTTCTMTRCVEFGARFLVKKPLNAETMHNIWQHLDVKVLPMNKTKYLFPGIENKILDGEGVEKCEAQQKEGTKKRFHLMWTPHLQRKFLYALEILGDKASPKKIMTMMNVATIRIKQVSAHLQKHRIKMEKQRIKENFRRSVRADASGSKSTKTFRTSPSMPDYRPKRQVQPPERTTMQSFSGDTQDRDAYKAFRRAFHCRTVFDESQYFRHPSSDDIGEATIGYMTGEDVSVYEAIGSNSYGQDPTITEPNYADVAQESTSSSRDQFVSTSEVPVVGLVDYSDSEDELDEVWPSPSI